MAVVKDTRSTIPVRKYLVIIIALSALLGLQCICKWFERFEPVMPDNLKWSYDVKCLVNSKSSPAIGQDGVICFGTHEGYLYVLSPSGSLKWRYAIGKGIYHSPVIAEDGTIYLGLSNGYLYALNPSGSLKWRYRTIGKPGSSPAIGNDGAIYLAVYEETDTTYEYYKDGKGCGEYSIDEDYYLRILNPDGSLRARYGEWEYSLSAPVLGCDGTIYFTGSVYLYALRLDGSLKWRFQTRGWVRAVPAIDADGTIYFGSEDKHLYAINPNGGLKWKYLTKGNVESSPVIGEDGTIYFGSNDGHFYALNPDGSLKWRYETGGYEDGSAAIGSDGTIYFHSYGGTFYAFNLNGTVKWQTQTGYRRATSPAIGSDGTVYLKVSFPVDKEGNICLGRQGEGGVYALECDSKGLADSPWPKYRCDAQNTGRVGGR